MEHLRIPKFLHDALVQNLVLEVSTLRHHLKEVQPCLFLYGEADQVEKEPQDLEYCIKSPVTLITSPSLG